MISEAEKAILEIGSGAWCITAASLVIVFGLYCLRVWLYDPDWGRSPTFRAALALIIFGAGSAMRASLAWFRFANGDYGAVGFILTWWPWFELSILANTVGAVFAVYTLSPSYRGCMAIGVVVASFGIPTLIYLF